MAGSSRIGVGVDSQTRLRGMEDYALSRTPRPYVSGVDEPSLLFNTGVHLVNSMASSEVSKTQAKAQEILSSELGREDAQARLDPLKNKLGMLSLVSSNAGTVAEAIQTNANIKYRKEEEAEDRLNEKMALHGINSAITQSLTAEDFQRKAQDYIDLVKNTNTHNVSNHFLANAKAFQNYGNTLIENTRRSTIMGKTGPNYYKSSNNEFRANFQNPTFDDVDQHLDGQWENIKDLKSSDILMSKSIFELMSDIGTPEILDEVLNKWGNMLSAQQKSNLTLLVSTRKLTNRAPASNPLESYVTDRNAHGAWVDVDEALLTNPRIRNENSMLRDSVNMKKMSPENLRAFAGQQGTSYEAAKLAGTVARNIELEFDNDVDKAIVDFGIDVETKPIPVPVLGQKDKMLYGVPEFLSAFENRVKQMGYVKNDWFGGTDAIDNVFNATEKQQLHELTASLTDSQKWGLASLMMDTYTKYNKALTRPGAKKFSSTYNIAETFGDNDLSGLLQLEKNGEISGGLRLFSAINSASKGNPDLLLRTKKELNIALINNGLGSLSPILRSYLLGRLLTDNVLTTKPSDTPKLNFSNMGLEIMSTSSKGGVALAQAGSGKMLAEYLKGKEKSIMPGIAGKYEKAWDSGILKVEPLNNSMNLFHVFVANTKADAAAGNWMPLLDELGEELELDLTPRKELSLWERAKNFVSGFNVEERVDW